MSRSLSLTGSTSVGDPVVDAVAALRSARRRRVRRSTTVAVGLTAVVVVVLYLRVLRGDYSIAPLDAVAILRGQPLPPADYILLESTLPRAAVGLLAGYALGFAGAALQDHVGNPVAAPDVLGVTAGAALGGVWGSAVLGLRRGEVTVAALLGAVLATGLAVLAGVTGPGSGSGSGAGARRILVLGVAVASACAACSAHRSSAPTRPWPG